MAPDLEKLVREIEALPREQKFQLVKRLQQDGFFAEDDQSWYWTRAWQAAEKEADSDTATGRVHEYNELDDLLKALHRRRTEADEK